MTQEQDSQHVWSDVACTLCGCVCDDLTVTVRNEQIVRAERACQLAEPWLLAQNTAHPPKATIEGRAVSLDEAIGRAVEILQKVRSPLIYGLSRSSTPGQRAAVSLADRLGATIDTAASRCHAPSILALQQVGESTCSLGEVKNRANLVIYWGSNPAESHPRHGERYAVEPAGEFVPRGRADRHVVVVDVVRTATAELADTFLEVPEDSDFDVLWALRGMIRDTEPQPTPLLRPLWPRLRDLAERMRRCRCGVVFFGLGLARGRLGHQNVQALLQLVTDLNGHTRFYARRMRVPGDVAGADSVLCWQTGYPFSVNLGRGYPRYNPGEFSANDLLERSEVDACVLVGSADAAGLSLSAKDVLERIPTISLDPPERDELFEPTVRFTTGVYGIHVPGTVYRMDEVPIPLRAMLKTEYPSDAEILAEIETRLTASCIEP